MFRNYLKISWRNLRKQKLYSVINIGGLCAGLTCFLLSYLFVQHEMSYDRFYPDMDRTYRIIQRQEGNLFMGTDYFGNTPGPLAPTLLNEYPEVEQATTVRGWSSLLSNEDQHYWEKGLAADQHFFKVLQVPFVQGRPGNCLAEPNGIVLSQSLASKIFGESEVLGNPVQFGEEQELIVTGVYRDLPDNSSLQYDFVVNIKLDDYYNEQTWSGNAFHAFLTLRKGASPQALQDKLPAMLDKYQQLEGYPFHDTYYVEPVRDMHLRTSINADIGLKGSKNTVYLFSVIGIIVLLLACINYMNLAIARSIKRAREVGLRKTVGAVRSQLLIQFLGESVFIALLALVFAVGLTYLLAPVFGDLMERPLSMNFKTNPLMVPGLFLLVLLVGVISGSYPAFFMASLKPTSVLKGRVVTSRSGMKFQNVLITGQYIVSIILIVGSLVMHRQLQYIQEKELGYDKEHVLSIGAWDLMKNYEILQHQWLQHPDIQAVTYSNELPVNISSSTIINDGIGMTGVGADLAIYDWRTGYDFLNVFGIQLIAGRTFSPEIASDATEGYLINETAAKALGWSPQEAVGKQFTHDGKETVIGVVKDFHMHSMHLQILPLMIRIMETPSWASNICLKIDGTHLKETLQYVESSVKEHSVYPVEYKFLDDHFDQLYRSETRLGEIFGFFTIVAILIAALGLFGLSAFTSEQRTKEVGIRKVLGATVQNIVTQMSSGFIRMVLIAFVIAAPVSFVALNRFLQDFAYRIQIEWWLFGVAFLLTMLVALMATGYPSYRASIINPVESLRSE